MILLRQRSFSDHKKKLRDRYKKDYIENTGLIKQINPSKNPTKEQLDRYIRGTRRKVKERLTAADMEFAYSPVVKNNINRKINAKARHVLESSEPILSVIKRVK